MNRNLWTKATVSALLATSSWLGIATAAPTQATEAKPAQTQPATQTKDTTKRDLSLREIVPALQQIVDTARKNGGKISEAEIDSIFKARIAAIRKDSGDKGTTKPPQNTDPKPSPTPTPGESKPETKPSNSSQSETDLEQAVFKQINDYRASQGLPALKQNDSVSKQARLHSQNMASGKVAFGHSGFDQRVKEIGKTVKYTGAGENVAWNSGNSDPVKVAVDGWLKSPGHLANIKGNYGLTGIGVSKNSQGQIYFTQIFVRQ